MDVRKLQRTGGSSITITLPKKWIEKNQLKDKDLLKIYSPSSNMLVLQPENVKREIHKTVLNIDNLTINMITRELISHYISGADEIVILSQRISPEQRSRIRDISNFLTGFEIIDETGEKVTLRNIFDLTKLPIPKNIEKMFSITTSMFQDVLKSVMENDASLARDVIARDFEIDKLNLIIIRQLHSIIQNKLNPEDLGIDLSAIHYYEEVGKQIERIADHAEKIAVVSLNSGSAIQNDHDLASISQIAGKITKILGDAKEMVNKLDRKSAHKILDNKEEIKTKLNINVYDSPILTLISYSFDRVLGYIANIAESTIDQSIEKECLT